MTGNMIVVIRYIFKAQYYVTEYFAVGYIRLSLIPLLLT